MCEAKLYDLLKLVAPLPTLFSCPHHEKLSSLIHALLHESRPSTNSRNIGCIVALRVQVDSSIQGARGCVTFLLISRLISQLRDLRAVWEVSSRDGVCGTTWHRVGVPT